MEHIRHIRTSLESGFNKWVLWICLGVALLEILYVPLVPFAEVRTSASGEIPKIREEALNLYKDRVQNMVSLAVGMAGAATLGAYNRWANRKLPKRHVRVLQSCWMLAGLSIFSGLIGVYNLQRIVEHRIASTQVPIVSYPALVQIAALVAGAPFLIWFIVNALVTNKDEAEL